MKMQDMYAEVRENLSNVETVQNVKYVFAATKCDTIATLTDERDYASARSWEVYNEGKDWINSLGFEIFEVSAKLGNLGINQLKEALMR